MTVRRKLIDALRQEGWDFLDACDCVKHVLDEFLASSQSRTVIHTARHTFFIRRKDVAGAADCGCGSTRTDESTCPNFNGDSHDA
jgi:hypothetical protein